MKKVLVLFFSADPSSAPPHGTSPRLRLDEDVRQIRAKVRAAEYRDSLDFDLRLAATADDMVQALNETHPQVVHFSGHGRSDGLVLVGADGKPHRVGADALAQLFRVFRGDIRVVVLNACFSLPQAEAIAATVGCAIGTRRAISDEGSITFGASFYRAVAFGHSVRAAFDQAAAALALSHSEDADCPVLVAGPGVDPARLVLVRPDAADPAPAATPRRPVEEGGPPPPGRPPIPRRRAWLLPAAIWLASVIGAVALAEDAGHALVLALASLVIAAALMRFLHSAAGGGAARSAGASVVALALSAATVLVGTGPPDDRSSGDESAASFPGTRDQPRSESGTAQPSRQPDGPVVVAPVVATSATDSIPAATQPEEPDVTVSLAPPPAPAPPASEPASVETDLPAAKELYKEKRYAEAHPIFRRAADAGNVEAKGYLGILYLMGWGAQKQPGRALVLLREAAAEGDARAMNAIGVAYESGEGVSRDYGEAMRWFQQAQARGYADAMNNIGGMYRQGRGVERDDSQALHWYRKAAGAGSLDGTVNVGLMHERGMGTARDLDEAIRLYGEAADAGSARAMVHLGMLHQNGDGVPRDYGRARNLFLAAANAGSADGMNNMGTLHFHGWGMPRNREQAIHWFRRAAAAGSKQAAGNLEAMGVR